MSWWKSLVSLVWPVREWKGRGKYGPLELIWEQGQLVVNSDDANLSYGNLHAIWQQCLDDQQVKNRRIRNILLLGFGAGSSASILRRELGITAPITGVDGDPEMLRLARTFFKVERFKDLTLVEADALVFMEEHQQQYDLVLVDLCHGLDLAPGVEGEPFIRNLRRLTADGGLVCFNTIVHDEKSRTRSQRVSDQLRHYFDSCEEELYQSFNRVLTATWTSQGRQAPPSVKNA